MFGDRGTGVGHVGQGTGARPSEALWATASKCMSDTVSYFKRSQDRGIKMYFPFTFFYISVKKPWTKKKLIKVGFLDKQDF